MKWEDFLTTKFGLWIVKVKYWQHSSRQRQGRETSGILLQTEKAAETSGGDLTCYLFSFEDAVTHLSVTDSITILTIEK